MEFIMSENKIKRIELIMQQLLRDKDKIFGEIMMAWAHKSPHP